jgi:peptide deformylase
MTEVKGQVEVEEQEERLDPEREARRRAALAQVRQYPDPVLRMRANAVETFDDALASLVERMTVLMQEAAGVGLAAPQLGILQRVFALVNPTIAASSDEREAASEGCLSLGASSVVVDVERPVRVTVEGSAPSGEPVRVEANGLVARVVQHELDHLDGVLTIDRTSPEQRREALARLRPQPVLGPLA